MAPKGIGQTDWISHAIDEMKRICAGMDPGSASADAEAIRLIASRITLAADMYYAKLAALYPEGDFHGESVTGSRHATIAGIRHMDDSASVGIKIADQISAISAILSSTQGSVADLDAEFGTSQSAAERFRQQQQLAKTMTDVYSNPVIGANSSMPEYSAAPLPQLGGDFQPVNTSTAGGVGGGSSGDNSGLIGGMSGGAGPGGPGGPGGPAGPGAGQVSYGGDPAADVPLALGNSAHTTAADAGGPGAGPLNGAFGSPIPAGGQSQGAGTNNAAMNSARGQSGSGPGGRGGAGGGSGGAGGGRGGGAGGLGGAGSEPSPLGRRPITPLASPSAGTGAAPGSGPATSTRGGSPMVPPGGAGRGGRDANGEHRAASYLHTRENAEEMIGPLPLVGPPVLGDWARPVDTSAADVTPMNPDALTDNDKTDNNKTDNSNRT